jgi:hypothetical protein
MASVIAALEETSAETQALLDHHDRRRRLSDKEAALSRKEQKASRMNWRYPSVAYQLAHDLEKQMGQESA